MVEWQSKTEMERVTKRERERNRETDCVQEREREREREREESEGEGGRRRDVGQSEAFISPVGAGRGRVTETVCRKPVT